MYVLQANGQLIKTNFILKYLLSVPLRRKINTQLVKGEQLHNLRLYLWFGSDDYTQKTKRATTESSQEPEPNYKSNLINLNYGPLMLSWY